MATSAFNPKQGGFTLLELLIAMTIFAILSTMAYSALRNVLETRNHAEAQADRLGQMQMAFLYLGRDIEETLGRDIRDSYGSSIPAFRAGGQGTTVLELTRTGSRAGMAMGTGTLQRIAYKLQDEKLSRLAWRVLDQAPDSQPMENVLLEKVKKFDIRYLNDQGMQWMYYWPPQDIQNTPQKALTKLPMAVELTLEIAEVGKIRRVFRVPSGEYGRPAKDSQAAPGTSGGGVNNGFKFPGQL
ncbi:MAG: type II secretion system minor pseudopilin GspJ [Pseudomonadota bacterium]